MKHDHILIIRFSALGDVAMTVPVVYSLAKQYPDVRITMLSRPFASQLFQDLAPNVNFMEADLKTEYHGVKASMHFTADWLPSSLHILPTCTACCALNTCAYVSTWDATGWNTSIKTVRVSAA